MAMAFNFLSGNVPGGIFILAIVLFVLNLTIYFVYKKSGLFNRSIYKKKFFQFNLCIIATYIFLWLVLQPPGLPVNVLIVPCQRGDGVDFALTEALEEQLAPHLSENYRLHRWEWFYLTADKDSLDQPAYRYSLAKRLKIRIVIGGYFTDKQGADQLNLEIFSSDKQTQSSFLFTSYPHAIQQLILELEHRTDLMGKNRVKFDTGKPIDYQRLSQAKLAYLNKQYDQASQILNEDSLYQSRLLLARCFLQQGILVKKIGPAQTTVSPEEVNPFFLQMEQLLLPYSIKGEDTAELNLVLGQMYLYRQDFETASICLKKAFVQNHYEPRVFYNLSFLLSERLEEMGYKSRMEVLERSIELDPGFVDGSLELSQYLYEQSSGSVSALRTQRALEILESFLTINPRQTQVLKLLGKIYLQSKYVQKAMGIFERVIVLEPDSADNYYNLGICLFNNKEYPKAKKYFEQAIQREDHRDSYLYLGAIYRLQEDLEKALFYYRERIKRKTGDDDYYAKEAMRGVRLILEKQQTDSTAGIKTGTESSQSPIRK